MAAARVRGFQGQDLSKHNTLLACAKHFVAYGGAEGGRDYNTVDISERTLHEIYLPPFHAAVNEGVGSVMGGFNQINGIPMHANRYLLTEILRGKWDFNGLGLSDYNAIAETIIHAKIGANDTISISVELENVGKRTGSEVVQLYIQDLCASVTRPVKELRGFQRVTIKAGEKTKVYFQLTMKDFAFYNLNMKRVVEPGFFKVFVGTNSEDVLETQFEYVGGLLFVDETY